MENDTAAELARLDRVERHLRRCDAFDRDGSAHHTGGEAMYAPCAIMLLRRTNEWGGASCGAS